MSTLAVSLPTIYQECYKSRQLTPPPIKYRKVPSFVQMDVQFQPSRQFPIEPTGPARRLHLDPAGPVLGLGTKNIDTEKYHDPKPILCTLPPQKIKFPAPETPEKRDSKDGRRSRKGKSSRRVVETKFGPMDSEMVDRLAKTMRWTSTTHREAEDVALDVPLVKVPNTTLEIKADQIRLGGKRYESEPAEFQKAVLWDCIQSRGSVKIDDLNVKTHGLPEKLLHKRRKMGEQERIQNLKSKKLLEMNKIATIYLRQCPGYSGFLPRQPLEIDMERKKENPHMVSTMRATYKQHPMEEYKKQEYAKKGPLSKTVTLTYPFNPYNKVVKKHH